MNAAILRPATVRSIGSRTWDGYQLRGFKIQPHIRRYTYPSHDRKAFMFWWDYEGGRSDGMRLNSLRDYVEGMVRRRLSYIKIGE